MDFDLKSRWIQNKKKTTIAFKQIRNWIEMNCPNMQEIYSLESFWKPFRTAVFPCSLGFSTISKSMHVQASHWCDRHFMWPIWYGIFFIIISFLFWVFEQMFERKKTEKISLFIFDHINLLTNVIQWSIFFMFLRFSYR